MCESVFVSDRFSPSCWELYSLTMHFYSWMSLDVSVTELCVVYTLALLSGAPKLVCRRNNDPNTRRLFDSSELRDVNEPVLLGDDAWFGIYMFFMFYDFLFVCMFLIDWSYGCVYKLCVCPTNIRMKLNKNRNDFSSFLPCNLF